MATDLYRITLEATEQQFAALALAARHGFDSLPPEKTGPERASHGHSEADWTIAEEMITGLENVGPNNLVSA